MIDPKMAIALVLAMTLVLFVWGRWRYDIVAICSLLAAVLLGAVPAKDAFSGFGDPAVITVALVLVISAAIRQSGILERGLRRFGGVLDSPGTQVIGLTAMVTVLSAFMNNIGALAIIMPLAIASAERAKSSPSVVLMPLAFGSLLGGLVTLIGTPPNLLISNVRQDVSGMPFSMFDFAPVGGAVALAGVLYLSVAWRLLPRDRKGAPSPESKFRISDFVTEARVGEESPFDGKTIGDLEAIADGEVTVIALTTGGRTIRVPQRSWRLAVGDVIAIEADAAQLKRVVDEGQLVLVGDKELSEEHAGSTEIGTIEVVVSASSDLVGRTAESMRLRELGVNLLAVSRQGRRRTTRIGAQPFKEGDVLALQGDIDHVGFLVRELGLLPLADRKIELGRRGSGWLPLGLMAAAVAAASLDLTPIAISFLAAVVVLAITRVMRPGEMYEAIDPSIIILMAALIPVTTAVQTSGGTEVVSAFVRVWLGGVSPMMALAAVMFATMLVTPILNNAATVLLMGPIAASFAKASGLNVDAFLMAVAIGASCDFLTPFGHQSCTLVMGPGGYKFSDYPRLGAPLTLIVAGVALPMIAYVWPLTAG